jgi:mannose-1-phosphate guanylyltransferase
VNSQHRHFYREELGDTAPHQLVEQPINKGTGAAVIYALAKLKRLDPDAVVGFFPADHHVDDVSAFLRVVSGAYQAARLDPTRIVLVGTVPTYPESDYGWIIRGAHQSRLSVAANYPIYAVESFVEKPRPPLALSLMANGGLWNTFVLVGRLRTFFSMLAAATPSLCLHFGPLVRSIGGASETFSASLAYESAGPVDFSKDVLSTQPERLAVIEAPPMGWTDLGQAERLLSVRHTTGIDARLAAS